ncbi:MAG: UDP-N-acetylmuramate dehydrogenase [Solirubrobacterales bacterium]
MSQPASVPGGVERDYPLARLTTIRTGGNAEYFARVETLAQLEQVLAWAASADLEVGTVGSGSNLLVADAGFRGVVVKLDGQLAKMSRDREEPTRVICGGGARLPRVAARTADLGLSGLEFGVNIPGTVGGAVRMNANAYGGELARVLEWVDVVSSTGTDRRTADQLDFAYRSSNIASGEVAARASFALERSDVQSIKHTLKEMRAKRRAAQPAGIKTFGSTFKNPEDERAGDRSAGELLEQADCAGLRVGGARFSPKHANFIENVGGEASTADVLALIAEGRRRVRERFGVELESEVQLLGDADFSGGERP